MILFEKNKNPGAIYVDEKEDSAVLLAVQNLAADIEKVCHVRPRIVHEAAEQTVIYVGTIGRTALPEQLRTAELEDGQGRLRWEGYLQQVLEGCVYLTGCDRRGTIYAVYDLCERMGVSPWYDMADVPVREHDVVELPDDWFKADWPCVQYRGIFLNDEEELDAWARAHTTDGTIGPQLYARIFELILRLKGNYIWPAMHVNAFNSDPENGRLAQRMGVVTGTSHCDMLHRSNQNEWGPWVSAKGYAGLRYDYTISGQNRERLMEYWRESLEQNRDCEACYTIGMRGIHDTGFVAENLEGGGGSPEEVMAKKRALLEEIMEEQRKLIRRVIGRDHVPQSFVPYKEVLPIYDSGLRVPEDVTLVWVDDNHGYMRRYPNAQEKMRSGGNGLYYHSSYWAPPGMSYLFVCSIPLAHMANELKKCYEQGIRRMWVDNVGALKPIEQDMEFFLRYGWDAGRPDSTVHDAALWTQEWIDRNFSGGHGKEAAEIYTEYTQLSNLCKPEHMHSFVFSQTAYGDEAGARVLRLYELAKRGEDIWRQLPERERAAFFQLLLMKMKAAFFIAASYYYADRSRELYELGAMRGADENMRKSREMDDLKRLLLHYYNHVMSEGKWSRILTPEDFPPPPLELYPACAPALTIGEGRLLVRLPDFSCGDCLGFAEGDCGPEWFDLLNAGAGSIPYSVAADAGINVSKTEGSLQAEERIFVRLEENAQGGSIHITSQGQEMTIRVCRTPDDGFIHMAATEFETAEGFLRIPGIGRGMGDAMEACAAASEEKPAVISYAFTTKTAGEFELEIIRFLTLNSTGTISMELLLDGRSIGTLRTETTDEWRGNWIAAVKENGEKLFFRLPFMEAGEHTLTIAAAVPYVTLSAVNLYTRERVPSMMGPGMFGAADIPDFDTRQLAQMYGTGMEDVPLPYVVVAGREFWKQDMLYARNERYRPLCRSEAKKYCDAQGHKDVFRSIDTGIAKKKNGRIMLNASGALGQSENAWITPGTQPVSWSHRQAESDGRSAIAMWIPADDREKVVNGPSLNYRFECEGGSYSLWMLVKYDDVKGFHIAVRIDDVPLKEMTRECHTDFHTYRTISVWHWLWIGDMQLDAGVHVLGIQAVAAGAAIDKIVLTDTDDSPSAENHWGA